MDVFGFLYFLVALLATLTVHESSHAMVAYYLGDPTAKMRGRMSLNPIAHLDLMGSLVFILTQRIGWGKPVPINPANFKNPVRDSALTALAGPMSNLILAFAVVLPWKYLGDYMPRFLLTELQYIFHVSIFLGIFNLFPFPPLDGSKILGLIIPKSWHRGYMRYLMGGMKYFVAIILIDVFILKDFIGFSIFHTTITYLHDLVSAVLWLGT
ncbi:MAG: site-2 protease family protein [Nitrospirae bacterium]|nr:site-2 protease family protein [Nitrospirota bacterium]